MLIATLRTNDYDGNQNFNNVRISLNGSTSSTAYYVGGDMSGGSGGGTSNILRVTTQRNSPWSPLKFYVTNYSSTTKAKQGLARIWAFDNSTPSINILGHSWASTSAVTSITLTNINSYFLANCKLSLYEIQKFQ